MYYYTVYMSKINHLFVSGNTNMRELESTLEKHGDSISYLKIASAHHDLVDIWRVCSMVRWSAISVCMGWGVVENEARIHYSMLQKLFGDDKKVFRTLADKWVSAIELPAELLDNKDIVSHVRGFFPKRLVEVGVKTSCFHPLNSLSSMQSGVQKAQEWGADHIVLEWSGSGRCGIYHANGALNILLVHTLMAEFSDKTRCIIEAPHHEQQDIWRILFWPETHIGNIRHFNQVNAPVDLNISVWHWDGIDLFIKRVQGISESLWLSWDELSRNEEINIDIINNFPTLSQLSDTELESYIQWLSEENCDDFSIEIPAVVRMMLNAFIGNMGWTQYR